MITSFTGEYRWLSNFYPCSVWLEGVEYPSVEHAYQAAKFPASERRPFLTCTAAKAKALGKSRPAITAAEKRKVMKNLLAQKFSGQPLRGLLEATGSQLIVEGNTWGDTFWGVCEGRGKNVLGELIMQVRRERP